MGKQPAFGNPLWAQMQKIKLTREGGLEAPVKADDTFGIVIGDPPLAVPPDDDHVRPSLLARLKQRLARI